ncbi:MAG: fibronectin type III domain-containing protein, partial [Bacteroidota bacterium]
MGRFLSIKIIRSLLWLHLLLLPPLIQAQNLEWAHQFGASSFENNLKSIQGDNGDYYFLASFQAGINVDSVRIEPPSNAMPQDSYFLAQFNNQGQLQGHRSWLNGESIVSPGLFLTSFCLDDANNIYIVGTFENNATIEGSSGPITLSSNGDKDIFFAKYDPNFVLQWVKTIGSTTFDNAPQIESDSQGDVYLYGSFDSALDFDPGAGDATQSPAGIFLSKYDDSGNFISVAAFQSDSFINAQDILVNEADEVVLTGIFQGTVDFDPGQDSTKLTSFNYSFCNPSDFLCENSSSFFVAKYQRGGDFIFARQIDSQDSRTLPNLRGFQRNGSGYLFLTEGLGIGSLDLDPGAGTVLTRFISGGSNILAKYDANMDFVSAEAYTFPSTTFEVQDDGSLVFWGSFTDGGINVDFDVQVGSFFLNTQGEDIFVAKYDPSLSLDFAFNIGGGDPEQSDRAFVDNQGDITLFGKFSSSATLDPSTSLISAGNNDLFLARYRLRPLDPGDFKDNPDSVCQSTEAITFQISTVPGADRYEWTIPIGAIAPSLITTEPDLPVTFDVGSLSGDISVKPVNDFGEGATIRQTLSVFASPSVSLSTNANGVLCAGQSLNLSASSGQGNYDFFVDGQLVQSGAQNTYEVSSLPANDNLSLRVVARNGNSCEDSDEIFLNVSALPITNIFGDTSICEGENLVLFAQDQAAELHIWRKGNTIVSTSSGLVINGTSPTDGGSDYSLEVINRGCSETRSFGVNIIPAPDASVRQECLTNSNIITLELRPVEMNADSYIWKKGNTVISTDTTVTLVNPVIDGIPEYTLSIVKDSCGSTSTPFALSVSVPGNAGPIQGESSVFRGESGLNYTVNPIPDATSYIWSLPNGSEAQSGTLISDDPIILVETLDPSLEVDFGPNAIDGAISVRGRNDCNGEGVESRVLISIVPFPAPQNLIATAKSVSNISLFWQSPDNPGADIELERGLDINNFTSYAILATGSQSFEDTLVQEDVQYFYRVRSVSGSIISSYSNVATAIARDIPIAPSNLTAAPLNSTEVRLNWQDNSGNENEFLIELASISTGNIFIETATTGANTQEFVLTGLEPNQAYLFRVRAANLQGNSPFSNIFQIQMPLSGGDNVPPRPVNIVAESASETQINLQWEENSDEVVFYKIQRSKGDANAFQEIQRVPVGTNFYEDEGLQAQEIYFYRILAANPDGDSAPSDTSAARAICNLRVLVTRADANSNTI